MVNNGQRLFRRAHLAIGHPQAFKRLRARHLVHEMPVNIKQAGAIRLGIDDMVVPDLVIKRARSGGIGHDVTLKPVVAAICHRSGRLFNKKFYFKPTK